MHPSQDQLLLPNTVKYFKLQTQVWQYSTKYLSDFVVYTPSSSPWQYFHSLKIRKQIVKQFSHGTSNVRYYLVVVVAAVLVLEVDLIHHW